MDLLLHGGEICKMALVLSGSTKIHSFETICPNKIPFETMNTLFLGLSKILYFCNTQKYA